MKFLDRRRVQSSFQRGACEYDQHTPVQQRVLEKLCCQTEPHLAGTGTKVLDIGCGTGRLLNILENCQPDAVMTGLDLSTNMLKQAAERLPATVSLVQGDAEHLPFPGDSFTLVVSSSTFQWLDHLEPCFKEVQRVLLPDGSFVFSLFGGETLSELRASWLQALANCCRTGSGQRDGTHRFHTGEQVRHALVMAGFQDVRVWSELEVVWYPDVPHLLQAIKRIGAGTARPPSGGGLGWRRVLHEMAKVYVERFGDVYGVPLKYEVLYAEGRR